MLDRIRKKVIGIVMAEAPVPSITTTETHTVTQATIVPTPAPPQSVSTEDKETISAAAHPSWYFDGSKLFFKFLRFLNMLEPDRVVVSMTKIMLWGATIQSMLVISTSTDWLTVAGALGLNVATMVKHETRRKDGTGDGE